MTESRLTTPRIELAVISPCSTCRNARSKPDELGRKPCPRAAWIAQRDAGDFPTKPRDSGLRASVEMPPDWLFAPRDINPVHLEDLYGQTLFWVATVGANGIRVLDTDFNTEDIVCEGLPYVPEMTIKEYYHQGELKGHQPLLITRLEVLQQWDLEKGSYIGGFARPVDLPSTFTKVKPKLDFAIPGA